jgi:hypothetical protein
VQAADVAGVVVADPAGAVVGVLVGLALDRAGIDPDGQFRWPQASIVRC